MIEFSAQRGPGSTRCIKMIAIGGAGANALDRMVLDGVNPSHLIAANSDSLALTASVAGQKIQLGRAATRGLGSGGDPDLGRASAEEAVSEIRGALNGADCVFLLAGLGGGTGSGATPLVAELAREAGALVIAVVTLPFAFEGKRRVQQAVEALAAVQEFADAVVCFENDRMADAVSPKAGIQQAFAAADQTISQSVQAITALLSRNGLIRLGFDDFRAALQPMSGLNPRCLFGYGEAQGDNRPYDALARALKNPLMDKGRLLRDCESVLVQVSGGPDLTLNEVQLLMEEFNRHVDDRTRILFGAAVDPQLAGRITVTIVSSLGAEEAVAVQAPRILPVQVEAPVVPPAAPITSFLPPEEPIPVEVFDAPEPVEEVEEAIEEEPFEIVSEEPEEQAVEIEADAAELTAVEQVILDPAEPDEEPEPVAPPVIPAAAETTQTSFFADEAPKPAPTKAVRPIPGRTLQPGSRMPLRLPAVPAAPAVPVAPATVESKPEPVPKPTPEPAPEPELPRIVGTPRPEPVQPVAPEPIQPPVAAEPPIPKAPSTVVRTKPTLPPAPVEPPTPKIPQQETMQFEPVTRGRFEKSEPTIVDGQDLDVPTFLRRNVRIR